MASDDPSGVAAVPAPSGAVGGLLRACHPLPTAAVTLLTTALSVRAGRSGAGCALVAGAVLAGQLSVGWCNDAVDAHRDAAAGRWRKPVVSGAVSAATVRSAAVVAFVLCVPLSLASGLWATAAHLTGVGAAWTYNLRLKAGAWSWLPYAVGFGCLPAFVTLGLPGHPGPRWQLVVAAALLGVGAHLANVLPDIEDDLRAGVRGWPQRLGPAGIRLLGPVPVVAASALLVQAMPGGPGRYGALTVALATLTAGGGALLGRVRPRAPFLATIAVAAADVVLLFRGVGG
ncbi:UbiA family prenyltransferase [Streptomyces sp. NPDC001922]|uniref:UbiA family prenyltransferase n=1 Tax=Streptomyces sp. NPDC001922 TaxID=3364624 RepID=UPI0036CA18E7